MDIRRIVGDNIRRYRAHHSMSQSDFGGEIGIVLGDARLRWGISQVSDAERGDRAFTVDDIVAIAQVFRVHPGSLLTAHGTVQDRDETIPYSTVHFGGSDRIRTKRKPGEPPVSVPAQEISVDAYHPATDTGDPNATANQIVELLELANQIEMNAQAVENALDKAFDDLATAKSQFTGVQDDIASNARFMGELRQKTLRYTQGPNTTVSGDTDSQEE
ncbi:helix-turn-helix domain-containing protein [Demequina iriomotensis]|uniref:helix-turn-helix domain-containing protein n=1 Tax=Demequina iriomotensis TaxID=1536641 RepID=UPI0007860520|nr:helix-turn-helix transcriptional regulator [Demequina iriomotensis]